MVEYKYRPCPQCTYKNTVATRKRNVIYCPNCGTEFPKEPKYIASATIEAKIGSKN